MSENPNEPEIRVIKENQEVRSPNPRTTIEIYQEDGPATKPVYEELTEPINLTFSNVQTRKEFFRCVYFLFSIQVFFIATLAFITLLVCKYFPNPVPLILASIVGSVFLIINITLSYNFEFRNYIPINVMFILLYTFLVGWFLGLITHITEKGIVSIIFFIISLKINSKYIFFR